MNVFFGVNICSVKDLLGMAISSWQQNYKEREFTIKKKTKFQSYLQFTNW